MLGATSLARETLVAILAVAQSARLGIANQEFEQVVDRLSTAMSDLLGATNGAARLHLRKRIWYVNGDRVAIDARAYAALGELARLFGDLDLGGLSISDGADRDEICRVAIGLSMASSGDSPSLISHRLRDVGVHRVSLITASEEPAAPQVMVGDGGRDTRLRSVYVSQQLVACLSGRRSLDLYVAPRVAKRVVQAVVDALLDEGLLPALQALVGSDEELLRHSVNTCVYVVILGAELAIPEPLLVQLGAAGLLHDVGLAVWADDPVAAEHGADAHATRGLRRLVACGLSSDLMLRVVAVCRNHAEPPMVSDDGIFAPQGSSFFTSLVRVADRADELMAETGSAVAEAVVLMRREAATGAFPTEVVDGFERGMGADWVTAGRC